MFFQAFLILVIAPDLDELNSRVDIIQQIGAGANFVFEKYYLKQLEAYNTCLPTGARFVNSSVPSLPSPCCVHAILRAGAA